MPSPENFAAVTKSRLRRVMICDRLPRAAPAHDVMAMTATMSPTPRVSAYATSVMMSGRTGMTRATLVTKVRPSSSRVPSAYPETMPMSSAMRVASTPPKSPTSIETREP